MQEQRRCRALRRLNDRLRQSHQGGKVMVTIGVHALGPVFVQAALRAVAAFDNFDAENNPYGEHDFGALTVWGERRVFKVDYYDRTLAMASPDPADPDLTVRVLTVMLVAEC